MGVLWDEILPKGAGGKWPPAQPRKGSHSNPSWTNGDGHDDRQNDYDMAEKGLSAWQPDFGRGSLMLLTRRVESDQDAERFVSAGYRFAELHQVSDIIKSSMQIQSCEFETKILSMSTYTTEQGQIFPGSHLGFFAV